MIEELSKICKIIESENLKKYNTYKLDCSCKVIIFPSTIEELKESLNIIKKNKSKWFILGNGSNIILPKYYDGVIIKLDNLNKCTINDNNIYVESGYMLNKLANELSNKGYTGIEWATGIPGTIGGAIYGNAGAYKSSMSEILVDVTLLDNENIITLKNEELEFSYRDSLLKHRKNLIVLSCNIKLEKGNTEEIKKTIEERTLKRIETQPLEYPNCGSVFRNPEGMSAGKLIDDSGLKGYTEGGAKISEKHANFIINYDNATSEDIIKLIELIKDKIKKNYNIDLVLEQEIIK